MPASRANKRWYWLLLLPYIALIYVPFYNRIEPMWLGVPFYYWYQLMWVPLSSVVLAIVFHFTHGFGKRKDAQ